MTRVWWLTPLVPDLRRQRQAELCEFKVSLAYTMSSRTARTHRLLSLSKIIITHEMHCTVHSELSSHTASGAVHGIASSLARGANPRLSQVLGNHNTTLPSHEPRYPVAFKRI